MCCYSSVASFCSSWPAHPHMYTRTAHTTTATRGMCPGHTYGCTPGLPQNSNFVLLREVYRRLPLCVPGAVVGGVDSSRSYRAFSWLISEGGMLGHCPRPVTKPGPWTKCNSLFVLAAFFLTTPFQASLTLSAAMPAFHHITLLP